MANGNMKTKLNFERKYLKVFIPGLHLILNIHNRFSFAHSGYSTGRWNEADDPVLAEWTTLTRRCQYVLLAI